MTSMEEHPPGSGRWRPAVPLPFYGPWHIACWECKTRFRLWPNFGLRRNTAAYRRYEEHYRAEHLGGAEVVS